MRPSTSTTKLSSEQLPPLSPSPPRATRERETHGSNDEVDRAYLPLPTTPLRCGFASTTDARGSSGHHHTVEITVKSNNGNSGSSTSAATHPTAPHHSTGESFRAEDHAVHLLAQSAPAGLTKKNCDGPGSAPLLSFSVLSDAHALSTSGYASLKGSALSPPEEAHPTSATPSTASISHTNAFGGLMRENEETSPPRRLSNTSSSRSRSNSSNSGSGSGSHARAVRPPARTRGIVFSGSEHAPHVPAPHNLSTTDVVHTGLHASASRSAVLPYAGVFLQPSTFRIGATGEDVLWALYQTNGVVASYLDQPCSAGMTGTAGAFSPGMNSANGVKSASPPSLSSALSPSSSSLPAGGPGGSKEASAQTAKDAAAHGTAWTAKSAAHLNSSMLNYTSTAPVVRLATKSLAALCVEAASACGVSNNSNSNSNIVSQQPSIASWADVEAEISRCLSGAGSSTPCLLTFDYVIQPARTRHFTEEQTSGLQHDPLVMQLHATELNRMEEVVPGSSSCPTGTPTAPTHTDDAGAIDKAAAAVAAEDGLDGPSRVSQAQQHKRRWLSEIPGFDAATEEGHGATTDPTLLRRRACGEVVQSCLYAARRAANTRRGLFFCEPLPTETGEGSSTRGSIHHVLSGSSIAEGSRLMPSPLWSGIHIALATMLVGEEAQFVVGSDDSTRFSAPLDAAVYMRAGTSNATATMIGRATSSARSAGGGGTSGLSGPSGSTSTAPGRPSLSVHSPAGNHQTMTFTTPHTRRRASSHSSRPHSRTRNDGVVVGGGGGDGRTHRQRRSRSNSAASRPRSSPAASADSSRSSVVSPSSSPASSVDRSVGRGGLRRIFPSSPQTVVLPPQQQQQQQQQQQHQPSPPTQPPHRKPSGFFSRVRDWRKKGRSTRTAEDKERDKTKEKEKEKGRMEATVQEEAAQQQQQQQRQQQSPPPPPHTSPTRTYPPPRRHSNRSTHAPSVTLATATTSITDVPHASLLGMSQPMPRPPQRARTPTRGGPAPLPSFTRVVPGDVRAYEAAVHGATEPVIVFLRLRERIPLLPTRSTSTHASLLVSAEPAAAVLADKVTSPGSTTVPGVGTSAHTCGTSDGVAEGSSATPTPPSSAPVENAFVRSSSTVSAGALSASTTATSALSESGQRRGIMTDALLCVSESNLMRPTLATTFHYLVSRSEATEGKDAGMPRGSAVEGLPSTAARHASLSRTPVSPAKLASTTTTTNTNTTTTASLAELMLSVLDRTEVRNAGRAALFAAMMYVMDGKLLNTRERAHVLESGCNEGSAGAAKVPLEVSRGAAACASTTSTAVEFAAQSPLKASDPIAPSSYVWVPYFRVSDAFRTFARHWQSGAFHQGRAGRAGSMPGPRISPRALHRALEEFTRYAHDTATVTYTVSAFNAVTQTYDACVPLQRTATSCAETTGEDAEVLRSCVGCVMHPCWLDAVLQASRRLCGTDIHVVTRGHAAEADERLFACSVLADIMSASQDAAAAFSLPRLPAQPDTVEKSAKGKTESSLSSGAAASPRLPTTPSGASTRPTTATAAARRTGTGNSGSSTTAGPLGPTSQPAKAKGPPSVSRTATNPKSTARTRSELCDVLGTADAAARRSLAASQQLLKRRGAEQQYRLRVLACEPVLTPQHFFANSHKEGLAAARALVVDAAVLLEYFYRVMDSLTATSQHTGDGSALSYTYSPAIKTLRLVPAVAPALRDTTRLAHRGFHSRQRLPYLLFGEHRAAILSAATARAIGMGCSSLSPAPSSPMASAAAALPNAPLSPLDGSVSPPIEVLAAAMLFFAPSAASAATTLTSRIPLALERVLLKVLPMLYLAIFLLTFGVDEAEVAPTSLLEHVYGAWWTRAASPLPTSTQCPSPPPPPPPPSAVADEAAKALYHRYSYLGECFHYLAFIYAELPGMRAMSWEACSMALFYSPRDAPLWALWASQSQQLGSHAREAKAARQIGLQLLAAEEARARHGASGASRLDGLSTAKGLEASVVPEETAERLGRAALLRYLQEQL